MKIDLIHDVQNIYRKILNSMSRPGIIENITEESKNIQAIECVYNGTVGLMLMLLDREVSYDIVFEKKEEVTRSLSKIVYGKIAEIKEADFIFLVEGEKYLAETLKIAKRGTLVDPHKSSTIICQVESLLKGEKLVLEGPGIKDVNYLNIDVMEEWIKVRDEVNREFPLGVDIIFIDRLNNIVSIPRTTKIIREVK